MSSLLKPDKWIDAEIARLDPEVDWAQIYRLSNAYRPNDFMLDLIYAHVFPHFMVPAHGAEPVWRDGGDAKVVNRASVRADDTSWHNMLWWYYGPDHPETKQSVAMINKIHAHFSADYPNGFNDHEDYIHVWCFSAATMHRLLVKMGLPGLTEHEKIAAHRFWKEIGALFVVPGDHGPRHPVDDFPANFDAILAWLEEYESRDWPLNDKGANTSDAVLEQFLFRYFPAPVRPAMRAVIVSFYADSVLKAYALTPPPRAVKALLRRGAGLVMAVGNHFQPDPTESYVERRLQRSDEELTQRARSLREQDASFARYFRQRLQKSGRVPAQPPASGGCTARPHARSSHLKES